MQIIPEEDPNSWIPEPSNSQTSDFSDLSWRGFVAGFLSPASAGHADRELLALLLGRFLGNFDFGCRFGGLGCGFGRCEGRSWWGRR